MPGFVRKLLGFWWLALLWVASAHATTLSISPQGALAAVANVPVTITVADTGGKNVESFEIRVNGVDAAAQCSGGHRCC